MCIFDKALSREKAELSGMKDMFEKYGQRWEEEVYFLTGLQAPHTVAVHKSVGRHHTR